MNNIPKVCLTINLEGSTLHRRDIEIPYTKEFRVKGKKIFKKKNKKHKELESLPCKLKINLTLDCYNFFISKEGNPLHWLPQYKWDKMSPIERLEINLNRLSQHHRGISYNYIILD